MITAFEAQSADVARRQQARARAELRLLGCICPIGRWGLAVAGRAGVTLEHFSQPDTNAIFGAMLEAEQAGWIARREITYLLARRALVLAGLWDEQDNRSFVGPMRWGPAALATLFCRVGRRDAERLLPIVAREIVRASAGLRGVA